MNKSPNSNHEANLIYEFEIRYGPAYFKAELDGVLIPNKIFGEKLFWSLDSKLLALEEWLTIDDQKGPRTRLLLINLGTKQASTYKVIENGFVKQVQFSETGVTYIKEFCATGRGELTEVDFTSIKEWKNIGL